MTPQSYLMVVAAIAAGREPDLRALLATMNQAPGIADAHNAVIPFARFDRIHFARFVILDDATLGDHALYDRTIPEFPRYLVFMVDGDGPAHALLSQLVEGAGAGLRQIFSHCVGCKPQTDLLLWLKANKVPVAANYVNWLGRSVVQIKQEQQLQRWLATQLQQQPQVTITNAETVRRVLRDAVTEAKRAGQLTLAPIPATPLLWRLANCLHLIGIPLLGLLLSPLLLMLLPFIVIQLRRLENSDPAYCPRPDNAALQILREQEDRDVSNQFSALGSAKPGLFRRWLAALIFFAADYGCRHVFNRGHLGRVRTIHFARWVFIDNKARVFFASNYDGSHEAYMDDFVNKVAWGLNLTFSHGIGWPHTDWLILRGARQELPFKNFQRRHQIPSQVWYKAYPSLTLTDLVRHQRIREGLEQPVMTSAQALEWLRLL
jgi:hypothetical protein